MAVARTRQGTNAAASAAQARSRAAAQQASQPPARSAALRSNAPPAVTLGPPAAGPAARRQAVMTRLRNAAARQQGAASSPATQRQASREAATEASRAAPSPANEARAQAQAGQAEVMNQQRAGSVQQSTFLELVERQLNAVPMPRNPEEMDRFRQNNSAGGLRQQLQGSVGEQSAQAQNNIRSATEAQPAAGPNRQPNALPAQGGPPTRGNLRAQEILPERRTEQQVSLDASRQQVEGQMRDNNLTEERLREANDPRFTAVQEARESVHEQAARAPEEYRAAEQSELQRQENAVARDEQSATREMSADRERANSQISTQQRQAMTREEAERRQVSERIERMFTEGQTRVQNKLTWLDGEVDRRFTEGEARAKQMFEAFVEDAMYQWKLRRYGRWLFVPGIGAAYALGRWVADKLIDISQLPEIQAIYDGGKRLYVRKMRELIVEIAGVVETSLRWCTDEIARSRQQIQDYVNSLPQALRRVGEETSRGVSERFDQLRNTVNERRAALANRLVERYRQAQQALDQRIQQMQAANRGLINRFVAAIREVIEIINNFRRQLMSLIGEARSVIDRIVERPVNFLRNLVRALRMGFDQFSRNIWTHLRSALLNWLFGTLAQAGIQMPQSFDLRSIIGLILQILGISYAQIRGKIARIIGERNMALLEHAWRYVSTLIREGPIGLWNEIRNDLSNLWQMALQAVREWVISQLVRAAITRLVSMFNPVGAIIQAVLMIYNTVMFFVEKIQQIMELVRTVVRSLDKIVRGDLAEAANWVENAMARTLPIIIAFLARLLGLSGIADRIREFITGIQARVDRAIDAALERIVGGIRRLFGRGNAPGAAASAAAGGPTSPARHQEIARNALRRVEETETGDSIEEIIRNKRRVADAQIQAARPQLGPNMRFTIALTNENNVEREGSLKWRLTIAPNDTVVEDTEGVSVYEREYQAAKTRFGDNYFKPAELERFLSGRRFQLSPRSIQRRSQAWRDERLLFEKSSPSSVRGQTSRDPYKWFSFSSSKAVLRPVPPGNRHKYGYSNPNKRSSVGLIILSKGIKKDEPGYTRAKERDLDYHLNDARYICKRTNKVIRFDRAVLGHKEPGASGHWNKARGGHTKERDANILWNRDSDNYQGPEEKKASSRSGGSAERYQEPTEDRGSHHMWWDPNHPKYIENINITIPDEDQDE